MNFRAARYKGEPVLTWWEGEGRPQGLGTGTHVILDVPTALSRGCRRGTAVSRTCTSSLITPHDTALVTSYEIRTVDLSAVGGAEAGARRSGAWCRSWPLPSGRVSCSSGGA